MTELDKFKRRTIRSVARLLLQKKPPDELWSEMKKETGTDCRVLWERMRALCIKKLNRMLAVADRSDSLPSIARLTLTDWLLVDLVLVHEEIDVIAMDKEDSKEEQKPLAELFNLVQRFEVEGRAGEPLAEAWAAATVFYNCQGRQCSPMLLQRRWYQLKKLTRCRFYKFWSSYRGNTRLLDEAKTVMPSELQMAVARRYPSVITKPFLEWEEAIKQRTVILPEEFESKMRRTKRPIPGSSSDPDLVVVEPVIETIDLRVESDTEDQSKNNSSEETSDPEKSNDATPLVSEMEGAKENNELLGIKIKTEPVEEDGLSNVQVIAATHVPEVDIRDSDSPEPVEESQKQIENQNIEEMQVDSPDDDVVEIPNEIPIVNIDFESPTKNQEKAHEETPNIIRDNVVSINDNDDAVDDIIKIKADEFCSTEPKKVPEDSVKFKVDDLIKDKVDTFLKTPKDKISIDELKPDTNTINAINQEFNQTAIDMMADLNFVDDGIEFVDDGVEFVEDDNEQTTEPVSKTGSDKDSIDESGNKFDLKLLMEPVVYTTRLDHMTLFINKQVDSVQNKEDVEKIIAESKPVSQKAFNINIKQEDKTSQVGAEALDNTGASDDLFTNQEESSDEEIPDSVKVSVNSNMLRKPRSRSYNPIQLCKNPDFNTKLRRLNLGFFSSVSNRQLLNACIPMTIDVSKSFESKLVDGTLYLKPPGTNIKAEPQEVVENQTSSSVVGPSPVPVQSLLETVTNVKDSVANQSAAPDPIVSERKKIISLPDIEKVRRINQQLLTAQVPPIRVYAGDARPPPGTFPAAPRPAPPPPPTPPPSDIMQLPTVVKVKSEANLDSTKTVLPAPETVVPVSPELPPAKKKLQKIINRAKILTQVALTKIDVGASVPETNALKQITLLRQVEVKPKPREVKKFGIPRVPVPWNTKVVKRPEQIDDFLITSDTLNKMLHLMGRDTHENNCATKPNPPVEKKKYKKKKKTFKTFGQDSNKNIHSATEKDANVTTPVRPKGRFVKYCCWARQKIFNRKRITKHTCPPGACTCCCLVKLNKSLKASQDSANITAIELSDDEDKSLKKACESIENVVQESRKLTIERGEVMTATYRLVDSAPKDVNVENVSTSTDMDLVPYRLDVLDTSALSTAANELIPQVLVSESPLNVPPAPAEPTSLEVAVQTPQEETPLDAPDDQVQHILPVNATRRHLSQVLASITASAGPPARKKRSSKSRVPYLELRPDHTSVPIPCPCQRPAVSQDTQRNIVIDASKKCPIHVPQTPIAPKNDRKVLYLNSKALAKSPSESPIFLGKNKILLTTVKFPRKEERMPALEIFHAPKIIPTLELPPGVQLVMLASGCVTYTLEPGTELSEAQLASLPSIIATVQEQLNSAGNSIITPGNTDPHPNVSPIIDLPPEVNVDPQTIESPVPFNLEAQEVFNEEKLTPKLNEDTVPEASTQLVASVEHNTTAETQPDETVQLNAKENEPESSQPKINPSTVETVNTGNGNDNPATSGDIPPESDVTQSMVETEIQTEKACEETIIEQSEKSAEKIEESNEIANNRKTLLSDLMEMSGISAEDTKPSDPVPIFTEHPVPNVVTNVNPSITDGVSGLSNNMLNADPTMNLPELSPVTSFAELKYACDQNGKFFKLDYDTGTIVPINVCIKKNAKNKPQLKPKAVIDLTDDFEDMIDRARAQSTDVSPEKSISSKPVQYIYNGQMVNVSGGVKPIKLFKACRPPLLKRLKTADDLDYLPAKKKSHLENRKQALHKIEARIDLVDSDAPMEEEYLVDSSDDDAPLMGTDTMNVESLDMDILDKSDDSSDDEPLAKKSKRMKELQSGAQTDSETNIRIAMDTLSENSLEATNAPEAQAKVAENEGGLPPGVCEESQSDADNDELDKDEQPILKFISDPSDNDGAEEDCILGV